MGPLRLLALALIICGFVSGNDTAERAYIEKYKALAVREMKVSGIPASIKLAQALVESDAGRSVLALRANNHFGIKCKSWWTGGEYYYADDDKDSRGRLTASCFRIYDSAEQSFLDHSLFLMYSDRYAPLFTYPAADYRSWADGLQSCGYSTSRTYSNALIRVIEKYELHALDISPTGY